jgi:hypothetical protein
VRRLFNFAFCILHFAFFSCVTTRAANESPIAPLTATSAADALQQLNNRRAQFPGARSLMRVRAGQQSFKAQLRVQGDRMELMVYTPLNTSAATLYADGDRVIFLNNLQTTVWQGSASELAGSLGLFASAAKPSDLALLILGFPLSSGKYEATADGLSHATLGSIEATFDPPSLPAKHVVVEHGAQRIEFEQLDVAATDEPLTAPKIPRHYQQGGVPRV